MIIRWSHVLLPKAKPFTFTPFRLYSCLIYSQLFSLPAIILANLLNPKTSLSILSLYFFSVFEGYESFPHKQLLYLTVFIVNLLVRCLHTILYTLYYSRNLL